MSSIIQLAALEGLGGEEEACGALPSSPPSGHLSVYTGDNPHPESFFCLRPQGVRGPRGSSSQRPGPLVGSHTLPSFYLM